MSMLRLQLNSQPQLTRDLVVKVTSKETGKTVQVAPFLDGSVSVPGLKPGDYRVEVTHLNLPFQVIDQAIKVYDRPTFVPLRIDPNLLSDTPIADTPEANLGPVQQRLDTAATKAAAQAGKKGGQPIYADDWNELGHAVEEIAKSTGDLSRLVSPQGHDHPELVAKLDEIQNNLRKFFDVFGKAMATMQRQLQQLALEKHTDNALREVEPDESKRRAIVQELLTTPVEKALYADPRTFQVNFRRAAEKVQEEVQKRLPAEVPPAPPVLQLFEVTDAIQALPESRAYFEEVQTWNALDKKTGSALTKNLRTGQG